MVNLKDCISSISLEGKLDEMPKYSITQTEKIVKISTYTLRYYDNLGLFPFLQRAGGAKRFFSDADIQWVHLIECLRNTGMSLTEIRHYVELCLIGNETLPERLDILDHQEEIMQQKLEEMQKHLKLLQFKKNYYKNLSTQNKE